MDKCVRCWRVQALCFCSEIVAKPSRMEWVILQHPRERKRSIGTARIARLGLENSKIIVGIDFSSDPQVQSLLSDPARRCYLLFPGNDSLNLSELDESQRSTWLAQAANSTVFVLDGTWPSAKTLYQRNPFLARLPKLCFGVEAPSEYGFREQPAPHCLSTLEAICRLMKWVEPEIDSAPLLEVFRKMVRQQMTYTSTVSS